MSITPTEQEMTRASGWFEAEQGLAIEIGQRPGSAVLIYKRHRRSSQST